MKEIVVTRHPALVELLRERGVVQGTPEVISHATPEAVSGARVIGVLPLHLAALAAEVVSVSVNVPAELRGSELSLEQLREYAGEPETYRVERID